MEETLEILLKENIINREDLLMRKHDLIGMTKDQALLILNILSLEKNNNKITSNNIQKTFGYTKKEFEELIASMMENHLVNVTIKKGIMNFNFRDLWSRLLKTFVKPEVDAKPEEVESYIMKTLCIKLTSSNKRDIDKWVKQNGTKRIISIIEGFYKMNVEQPTFKMLKEVYTSEDTTNKAKLKELEKIMKFDWVSK